MAQDENRVKRGRPQEVVDPVRVSVRLDGTVYDRLDRIAKARGTDVARLIRARMSALTATIPADAPR